jgi:AcrR family transcriptional regulator
VAQQDRAVRTRRAVLEAAASVFAEKGYAGATIMEILTRGQVTKGALYFHFDSKEALARGVIDAQVGSTRALPQELKLQEFVDTGLLVARRLPHDPLLRAGARLSDDVQNVGRYGNAVPLWIGFVTQVLEEARGQGELLPHVKPAETATMFVMAFHGTELMSQILSDYSDLCTQVSVLYDHILPAVAVPAVLGRIDTSPQRGAWLFDEMQRRVRESPEVERAAAAS